MHERHDQNEPWTRLCQDALAGVLDEPVLAACPFETVRPAALPGRVVLVVTPSSIRAYAGGITADPVVALAVWRRASVRVAATGNGTRTIVSVVADRSVHGFQTPATEHADAFVRLLKNEVAA